MFHGRELDKEMCVQDSMWCSASRVEPQVLPYYFWRRVTIDRKGGEEKKNEANVFFMHNFPPTGDFRSCLVCGYVCGCMGRSIGMILYSCILLWFILSSLRFCFLSTFAAVVVDHAHTLYLLVNPRVRVWYFSYNRRHAIVIIIIIVIVITTTTSIANILLFTFHDQLFIYIPPSNPLKYNLKPSSRAWLLLSPVPCGTMRRDWDAVPVRCDVKYSQVPVAS